MKKFWDVILGVVFIGYIIAINIMSGVRVAFSLPIIIVGIILMIYHFIKKIINESKVFIKGFKLIKMFLCIGLIWFLAMEAVIISCPKHSEKNADYILVLGAGLNDTIPTEILRGRLDVAIECIEKNDAKYIVVSGGQGEDEGLPEAHAMSKYLQDKGIDKEKIIIEDESRNTNQNFKFSKKKIEEHSHKSLKEINIKIVTTDFHAFRSSILAKKNGYKNFDNYSSTMPWYFVPSTYARESIAVIKSILFDK